MSRVVELSETDDDLHPLAIFPFLHNPADSATSDVGANLLGAQVHVDGVAAVDDLLQRDIDVVHLADLDQMATGRPHLLAARGGNIRQRIDDVAELITGAGMNVGGMGFVCVVLRGDARGEQE
jgi:hypothetical protein